MKSFFLLRGPIHSQRVGLLVMNLGTQHPNRINYWICHNLSRVCTRASGGRFTTYYKADLCRHRTPFQYHCSFGMGCAGLKGFSRIMFKAFVLWATFPPGKIPSQACNAMEHDGCWTSVLNGEWEHHRQNSCASAFWGRVSCIVWSATSLLGSDSDVRWSARFWVRKGCPLKIPKQGRRVFSDLEWTIHWKASKSQSCIKLIAYYMLICKNMGSYKYIYICYYMFQWLIGIFLFFSSMFTL